MVLVSGVRCYKILISLSSLLELYISVSLLLLFAVLLSPQLECFLDVPVIIIKCPVLYN